MGADRPGEGGLRGELAAFVALFVAAAVVAWASLGSVAADGPVGWDAYPMLAAAEGGPAAAFTTELMDGRYPDGRFYRPLVSLSVALDRARVSGSLGAGGYRPTDLLACALGAACVGLLARRLAASRGGPVWAGMVAGLVAATAVVLHHAQLEVVPFLPRRADGLCAAFLAATAYLAHAGARPWTVGLAALAAVLSKETGVVAVGLACAAEWARPRREGDAGAARAAALAGAVPLAAVVLALLARFAVLGELGGHRESGFSLAGALASMKAMGAGAAAGLPGGPVALLALVVFGCLRVATLGAARSLVLPGVWALAVLAITAFAGRTHGWYALHLVLPLALVAGLAVAAGLSHGSRAGAGAALAGIGLMALVAAGGRDPSLRRTLDHASEVGAEQATRFRALVEGLAPGDQAAFAPFFFAAAGPGGAPQVFVHAPYSLSALAELVRDDLGVAVRGQGLVSTRPLAEPRATVVLGSPLVRGPR